MSPKIISTDLMSEVCKAAISNVRLRSHYCLHDAETDPFQRMVVAIQPGSYVRPHRHLVVGYPENIVCLSGRVGVLIFDDCGLVSQRILLEPNGRILGCDIQTGLWHGIVSLEKDSAFLESKPGPYVPFNPEDFAGWSPEPDTKEATAYLSKLCLEFEAQ